MRLAPLAVAAGVHLIARDTVGSTNADALALARGGHAGQVWITASRQTAGRGRRGRSWVSEPGNLYASLLLVDPSPIERAPELSFVAALAVHDVIVAFAPELESRLRLKWPNDVLIDGAKVAGILIEGESSAPTRLAVAIGIGINCAHHPTDAADAIDLRAQGIVLRPESAFRQLSEAMLARLRQWRSGSGFPAVREDWLARTVGVGQPVRVRTPEREFEGTFAALDHLGRLIVDVSDGTTQLVTAGEVFPLTGRASRHAGAAS